ncbi:Glycosyltransferase involved in cell wall bisynthesis [Noviherbaspirillum humi]|uniref:Glycosyltransferase involved in cell wall bisynthesis n=2 Tax=Noviherbaspirillum humi TaxID=1688639 RepID=A0A239HKE0_9BURK|nr:Glycosyltransferase involved in cell wall bisynthesis [Noviherbaspirillum humi]
MNIAPLLLAQAAKPTLKRILESGYDFDLIDAHYFYPDGVAAVLLGKYFNKPVTITARGSDINLLPKYRWPRKWIHWASSRASAMITVCEALKQEIGRLDVDESRVITLRNGVDLKKFYPPEDRETERARLGLNNFTLLSVGNLIPLKGHHLVIEAVAQLPEVTLLIAGNGPEKTALENLARKLGVNDRVKILGSIPHDQLRQYYGAADALVLASSREGWANVLLESMACGTPVLATNVSGTPEVVTAPEAGSLINERSVEGIVGAVKTLRTTTRDRIKTRQFAERFSWDETTQGQLQLFNRILGSRTS